MNVYIVERDDDDNYLRGLGVFSSQEKAVAFIEAHGYVKCSGTRDSRVCYHHRDCWHSERDNASISVEVVDHPSHLIDSD